MKHNIISAYRSFLRKPATRIINLTGLSVSLALVIILAVYSYSELRTDSYHKNGKRIYLLTANPGVYMPGVLKNQIDLNIPEVEASVRVASTWERPVFQADDKNPVSSDLVTADPEFFRIFTYKAVEGNVETALNEPMTVVLTQSLAEKIFGKGSVLGKTVKINNDKLLTVSAVIKVPRENSSLSFNSVVSIPTREIIQPNGEELSNWKWSNFQLFVMIKNGADIKNFVTKTQSVIPVSERENFTKLQLTLLNKIYFSKFIFFGSNYLRTGNKQKIMILVLVAVLVLLIALINFMNISSSQWIERIKQTGVLKVIGANRKNIMLDILFESCGLFIIALFIAIFFIAPLFPFITSYTGIHFDTSLLHRPMFLILAVVTTLLLSIALCIIPAIKISSSKAVENLKKSLEKRTTASVLRGILVTSQFVIAIVLIAFTVLVQKQVNFGSNNIGINKENIIGIKLTPQMENKHDVLKKSLEEKPCVSQITFSQYFPGIPMSHWTTNQGMQDKKQFNFDTFCSDASFLKIMGLQLVQGRFFSDDLTTDKDKMVVNETFVKEHQLSNPLGTKLVMGFGPDAGLSEVVGVVKDFHYASFGKPIGSLIIQNVMNYSYCLVSLNAKDFQALHHSLEEIKKLTSELSPAFPVEINFFDQAFENMYRSELQFRHAFSLFAISAIVICCMGILAMSLFACQQRVKEIGIRKVNGATISEILAMLNRNFVKWVVIAFVIATPVAFYVMNKWLNSFAYKTELSWWIFALAGILALGIALLTVSWQSWRAATRNPVEALRYE